MKKNAVMLADTRPTLVGMMLLQLQENDPGLFDEAIIYYIDPISETDRERMRSIMPCRFIKYDPPLSRELLQKPRFRLFSLLMFCRYELFSYLDEFETVTWLDTDILIQGSLKGMLQSAKETGAALIREDPLNKTAEKPDRMRTCFTADLSEYNMDEYLYCSGTIVISQKIKNAEGFTQWCYEKTAEWANILSLPDQGVINAAIQKFNICVTPLSGKKYCCYPYMGRDCSQAAIVHAWGLNKFWNDWYTFLNFPAWDGCYKEWLQRGGSPLPFTISPQVSVVMPTYKPDSVLLRQCLDSLMSQNRGNWERFSNFEIILVAEPFEEDALREIVSSYNDRRIRLEFNKERIGIAASLNRGLRMAQGRYIARMDDDDLCAPARLYKQAEYLDRHPEITLCTSDFEYFGDMNESRISFEGDMSHAWSIFTCPFDHPTVMFRRDFFEQNGLYYDEKRGYVEDWELWRRAFQSGMRVGCIHEVLFYHRWINAGSAGQSNKTVDMMRELIQKNFAELGVSIPTRDLPLVGPWNGSISEENLRKLEGCFSNALEANKERQIYDQKSLEKAFSLRLEEARTGTLPGLSSEVRRYDAENEPPVLTQTIGRRKPSLLKRIFKAILKPLYRPFRHRYEDRIIAIQESGWAVEGHVLNCIAKLDQIITAQQYQIEQMQQELARTWTEMDVLISKRDLEIQEKLFEKIFAEVENSRQELSAKLFIEAENSRQELSAKLFTEAENTRQELSAKLFTEAENTRQELSAKLFTEAENTRCYAENRIWEAEQTLQSEFPYKFLKLIPKSRLERVTIHLVEHCNLNCQCCDNFSPIANESYTDLEALKKDFMQLEKIGECNIGKIELSGGEALLHPRICDFMSLTRKYFKNSEICIVTNGILLANMSEDFWLRCGQCNIEIVITKYPIMLNMELITERAKEYGVRWRYYEDIELKTSFFAPFDLEGRQNINVNFMNCFHANSCVYLKDGRFYTCSIAANVHHFNQYFHEKIPNIPENSISIYEVNSMQDILEFLCRPIPLCRYCDVSGRRFNLPWDVSKRKKGEWAIQVENDEEKFERLGL